MADDITDTMKNEVQENLEATSESNTDDSKVRKVFIKTFEEYCEATKRVVLLPKEKNLNDLVFNYAIDSEQGLGYKSIHLFGLYVPNDVEIKKICESFNKYFMSEMKKYTAQKKQELGAPEDYFSKLFVTKFIEDEVNVVNFERNSVKDENSPIVNGKRQKYDKEPFQDTQGFLRANIMHGLNNSIVEDLIKVMACEYKKMSLFNMDIRINALNVSLDINLIGNFHKFNMGYIGDAIIAPTEKKTK